MEVSLHYPVAPAAGRLAIGCQMTSPDGKVTDGIWKIGMTIRAGSTYATDANIMFGAGKDGWREGMFKVTCAASSLGEVAFQMSPGPSLLGTGEFRLQAVRFFPTGSKLAAPTERHYQDWFTASEATHIGIELSFVHPGWSKGATASIDCYYLQGTGNILGTMSTDYEIAPSGSAAVTPRYR